MHPKQKKLTLNHFFETGETTVTGQQGKLSMYFQNTRIFEIILGINTLKINTFHITSILKTNIPRY